jgi:hypothetical protein
MGYQVYWNNGRWQGYGVLAYCDCDGCYKEIDRGLGYQHEEDKENGTPEVFVCNDHQYIPINNINIDYKKEHPEWLSHILNHESWEQWRVENPTIVKEYELLHRTTAKARH